jgi:hypothetical protein
MGDRVVMQARYADWAVNAVESDIRLCSTRNGGHPSTAEWDRFLAEVYISLFFNSASV